MSLESAEKLVERILRQLRVAYHVETRPEGESPLIVADVASLSSLPPELHPYITPRPPAAASTSAPDGGSESDTPPPRCS
jgi:hypothetical protein